MPNERPRIRLVLADDHTDVLEEIEHLLAPQFDVLLTVRDGPALIEAVAELRPDAVVCDFQMPGLNGIEAGAQILRQGLCKAVVLLTMYNEAVLVNQALAAGIRGFVLKVDTGEELVPALCEVMGGGGYLSQGVVNRSREGP
jgi:DNA-binding NarL/FixJ family response regulator